MKHLTLATKLFNSIAIYLGGFFSVQYPLPIFSCKNTSHAIQWKIGIFTRSAFDISKILHVFVYEIYLEGNNFLKRVTGWKVCTVIGFPY